MKNWIKNKFGKIKLAGLVLAIFVPCVVFAASQTSDPASETLKGFTQILSFVVNIFTFLALVFLNFIGKLMDPELLIGDTAMESIRPMWVIIRNITNIGFVVVLIFLSASNLVSSLGMDGNWTIKDKLPKIILSLVAINFSLLGFRVVIDAVNVGTTALLSLSSSVLEAKGTNNAQELMQKVYFDKKSGRMCEQAGGNCISLQEYFNSIFCNSEKDKTKAKGESSCLFVIDFSSYEPEPSNEASNLFLAFGTQFTQLHQLPRLAETVEGQKWDDVISNTLFSSIMALMYIVSIVALGAVLLVRVVVLWMAMVFSPFLVAASIMGVGAGDIGKKIMTTLIVPIKVAAVFGVSFIMITTMVNPGGGYDSETGQWLFLGGTLANFDSVSAVLWQVATLIVFWVAIFDAMRGTWADKAVDYISKGAETMGTYAAKATVLDKPLIPMFGAGPNMSLRSMGDLPRMLENMEDQKYSEQMSKMRQSMDPTNAKRYEGENKLLKVINDSGTNITANKAAETVVQHPLQYLREEGNIRALADKIKDTDLPAANRDNFIRQVRDSRNINDIRKAFSDNLQNFTNASSAFANARWNESGTATPAAATPNVDVTVNIPTDNSNLKIDAGSTNVVNLARGNLNNTQLLDAWKNATNSSSVKDRLKELDTTELGKIANFIGIQLPAGASKNDILKELKVI